MTWSRTHALLDNEHVRLHVYSYRYEQPRDYSRCPDHDVLILASTLPPNSVGTFEITENNRHRLSFGSLMLLPHGVRLNALGGIGEQRLAACRIPGGILPRDIDAHDRSILALCSNIRDREVFRSVKRLVREANSPGFATDLLTDGVVRALRVDVARYLGRDRGVRSLRSGTLAPWQLRKIEDYTRSADGTPVRVNDLAAEIGISPGHLMRAFRESTGRTVHDFVEEVRLARARTLLLESELPIKEVAARLGFGTPSSFTLAFRLATGTTPARFRRSPPRWASGNVASRFQ